MKRRYAIIKKRDRREHNRNIRIAEGLEAEANFFASKGMAGTAYDLEREAEQYRMLMVRRSRG